jgi:hypothetical protein
MGPRGCRLGPPAITCRVVIQHEHLKMTHQTGKSGRLILDRGGHRLVHTKLSRSLSKKAAKYAVHTYMASQPNHPQNRTRFLKVPFI